MDDRQLRDLVGVVVEHIPDLIVIVDQTGVVRWANTRAEAVLSTTIEQWLLRPVLDIIHPDDLTLALELLVSARASAPAAWPARAPAGRRGGGGGRGPPPPRAPRGGGGGPRGGARQQRR